MRQVSLREFRTRGVKALEAVPSGETVLLAGQKGPAYFLIPVIGDVVLEDRELRRAMAKASLHRNWNLVEAAGKALGMRRLKVKFIRCEPFASVGTMNEAGRTRYKHHYFSGH